MEALTVIEKKNLAELESKLEELKTSAEKTFHEIGSILADIRDNRYYRETHSTFEQYCKDRWNISRPRAYQLIKSAEVHDNLSNTLDIPTRAVQVLGNLSPDQQREVYEKAVETAPDGKVTTEHIEKTIEDIKQEGGNAETAEKVVPIREEDSIPLFELKRWWRKAIIKDRKKFMEWIQLHKKGGI